MLLSLFACVIVPPHKCTAALPLTRWRLFLSLCCVVQVSVDLAVKPPQEGDPSYSLFQQERDAILGSLKRKAVTLVDAFQSMEGFSCNSPQGALYAFPRIVLPEKLVAEAEAKGVVGCFSISLSLSFLCLLLLSFPWSIAE